MNTIETATIIQSELDKAAVLKKGDTVVVHITGSSFYIAGKAVKA